MNPGRRIASFLLPAGVLFAVMVLLSGQAGFAHWSAHFAHLYAYAVVGVALLLGWRFDRSRLVFATVLIALCGGLLDTFNALPGGVAQRVVQAVAVLLPLNIALIAILKERGIFTWHGLLRWAVILGQPLALWLLYGAAPTLWHTLFEAELLPLATLRELPLTQPALLAFGVGLAVTFWQALRQHSAMESGLFWALALLLFTLLSHPSAPARITLFASAVLMLIIAVLEISYSMAFRDELTGLPGRRALNQALLKLGSRYTIAMLDVDHFKKFNDSYGHDVGDEVLKMVAAKMQRVGGGGKPFRYGGEEFTVLFAGKGVEEALPHLERLRESIASAGFTVRGKARPRKKGAKPVKASDKVVEITISIGAAERQGEKRSAQAVIKAADTALYQAKRGGRNRVAS